MGWEVRLQGPSQQHLGIRESPAGSGVHTKLSALANCCCSTAYIIH